MTNTLKLKSLLVVNKLTTKDISKLLGISCQSFSMKINNKREFKASEIEKMSNILKLSKMEMIEIFFALNVELNSTRN